MSVRFWLFSLASAGTALVSGLGLGLYATTPPRSDTFAQSSPGEQNDSSLRVGTQEQRVSLWSGPNDGPEEIVCIGCGPTLAQRQFAEANGGWDIYSTGQQIPVHSSGDDEYQPVETSDAALSVEHQDDEQIAEMDSVSQPTQVAMGGWGNQEVSSF